MEGVICGVLCMAKADELEGGGGTWRAPGLSTVASPLLI